MKTITVNNKVIEIDENVDLNDDAMLIEKKEDLEDTLEFNFDFNDEVTKEMEVADINE